MLFLYKKWNWLCSKLADNEIKSIPANRVFEAKGTFVVLKHDVETDVPKAHQMAKIETAYGHCGSYYVQAYLMNDPKNVELLSQMQLMGHEISYHYDVMDSTKGDLDRAIEEFDRNCMVFKHNGFEINTVCQHGNPIVERVGYTSNRDFFRNMRVRERYPEISDIMVNFKQMADVEYAYYSDAGRKFKKIFDPINNDIEPSDDKDVPYEDMDALLDAILAGENAIISTHPHRWTNSAFFYMIKATTFKVIKSTAKLLLKVPFMKKFMSRYYYLAKKI